MQKSSKMFVVNSVSGFEGFGGTPLPKLPLSASMPPSLPPSGFANLSPAVALTCCSSLAGVSCGHGQPYMLAKDFIEFAMINTVTGDETGLTFQLISTPSLPTQFMKSCTTPLGSMPLTLYISQGTEQWKICETRPMVLCPYPRRLECLTICRLQKKKAANSPQLF